MFSTSERQNLEFLTIPSANFKFIGIDLSAVEGRELIKSYWKFITVMVCILYVQYSRFNFIANYILENIDLVSQSLSIFNQYCLSLTKLAIILIKRNKFLKLMWNINLLGKEAQGSENEEWLFGNRQAHAMAKTYHNICLAAFFGAISIPLIQMAYEYKQNNVVNHHLPFGRKFPHDNGSLCFYILSYILTIFYVCFLLNITVACDTLYGWYIYSISAHFSILRLKVQRAAKKIENVNRPTFNRDIGQIVGYHNRILGFVCDFNDLFGEILLAEVLFSCLQLCFIIFIWNNNASLINVPLNVGSIAVIGTQLIIYCFGGEAIKNKSLMVSLEFYLNFPWHLMSCKERKLMLLPLMRSQKLSVLSGIFFEVDRALIVYVFKTAFSLKALLSVMNE